MPLPKSITSLLTAIVVAVPAAITTLALNKPKPPKEIDAVIQLDENQEKIPENEITPDDPPPPPLPSSSSPTSSSSGLVGEGAIVESGTQSPESGSQDSLQDTTSTENETKKETKPEAKEEEEEELEEGEDEEDSPDDNEDEEDPPTESDQQDKDPSIQELEESIVSIIGILINEGKDFDIKNSMLYKQYTISSKLVELKKTIESWQAKKAEKAKAAKGTGPSPGTAAPTDQQVK